MVSFLLYAAIIYLVFTSIIFVMNLVDFKPLLHATKERDETLPKVSICIPARNEERNIERALTSAIEQNYPNLEVIILDDDSTDRTSEILSKFQKKYPEKLLVIKGNLKPDNWLGKSWACHQLSVQATGKILFFIDADVWLAPETVARSIVSLRKYSLDFLTIWPVQQMETFWEKVVIPLVYYGLFTLLPARYVCQKPRWLPSCLARRLAPTFAAACGQCMVFRREAYEAIGGHQSVKNAIVEDVALAKRIKQKGFSMRMFHGKNVAWCRMYRSAGEMWSGFRKNFLPLFGGSVITFCIMSCINFIVFVLPIFLLFFGLISGNYYQFILSFLALFLMTGQRLILAKWYEWSKWSAFLHPLGVCWFLALGAQVIGDFMTGKRVKWKNRPV